MFGFLIIVLFNRIVLDSVFGTIPWSLIFISVLHICYVPLMFSWEKTKYSEQLFDYSDTNKIISKWLVVILYNIVCLLITSLLFFNQKEIIFGIVANALFIVGILSSIGISYAFYHPINVDIDSKNGYRKFYNTQRWVISLAPILIICVWGLIGQFEYIALDVYYKIISMLGIGGFSIMGIWIFCIYKFN